MSLDKFLNDFENQGNVAAERRKLAEEAKLKLENENTEYLEKFKVFYNETLVPQFDNFAEKLDEKFDLSYEEPVIIQVNNYFAKVTLKPLFIHAIKEVTINFSVEGGRKLVSLSGHSKNAKGDEIGDGIHVFQNTFEVFEQLNIEDQISEILDKIFIRK